MFQKELLTKGLGYKQAPDAVQKFVEVAKSKTPEIVGDKIGIAASTKNIERARSALGLKKLTEIPGVTTADKIPVPEKTKTREMFKNAFKIGKAVAKPIARAVAPFVPVLGTAGMVMGGADVAKAAGRGLRNEELGIAYLEGPELAQSYSDYKDKIRGKDDETEIFVP